MSAYTPSNSAASCPSQASDWTAKATPLPPTPNKQLCTCMYQSLGCVVASGTETSDYGTLFGTVCGLGDDTCAGIAANSTTGTYGAYGMCNSTEQLAYAFNNYYAAQSSVASACDFSGAAATQAASTGGSSCSSLMAEAGTAGTGTVTSSPSGTGGTGSGSGSGSSASSASSSKGAAGMNTVPGVESGLLPMGFIVTLAMVSGAGMLLL